MENVIATEAPEPGSPERGGYVRDGLHLLALSAFAVAQPLFAVLQADAAFFVFRRSQPIDLWLLAGGVLLVVPALLFLAELLVGAVSASLRRALHLVFVAALVALIALPPIKRGLPLGGTPQILAVLAVAGLVTVLYVRWAALRSLLSILAAVALLFGATFLMHPAIRKVALGTKAESPREYQVDSDTTVVFAIFDELPLEYLLNADQEIDARLFPNFARLAETSTWFKNATASHVGTTKVVPSILSGRTPSADRLPILADYPDNLFTLLADTHRMRAEERTQLCPSELTPPEPLRRRIKSLVDDLSLVYAHIVLPEMITDELPSVTDNMGNFGAAEGAAAGAAEGGAEPKKPNPNRRLETAGRRFHWDPEPMFAAFAAEIDDAPDPTLYFVHLRLPHVPWMYLPSGKHYSAAKRVPGMARDKWADEHQTEVGLKRFLLQLGYSDQVLGRLLDRLEEQGVLDRCLLVVLSDHGGVFSNGYARRGIEDQVLDQIAYVPFFVKEPFQSEGRTSDRNVESVDVLPTIADVLDVELTWDVQGSSALDESVPERPVKVIRRADQTREYAKQRPSEWPGLDRKIRIFGEAPDWNDVYRAGPRQDLLGQSTDAWASRGAEGLTVHVERPWEFERVNLESDYLPALVLGHVSSLPPATVPTRMAIALNGVIHAVTDTYEVEDDRARFAAILPESAFAHGHNQLEFYRVGDGEDLERIGRSTFRLVGETASGPGRLVRSDGQEFEIEPDALAGLVDRAQQSETALSLRGWAADLKARKVVDLVVVLHNGEHLFSSRTTEYRTTAMTPRPKAESKRADPLVGFSYKLPKGADGALDGSLRVFAVRGSVASELEYGKRAAWMRGE